MFEKALIANRGEIAVRIIRACEELGIRTVAVYSSADRDAPHVRMADEAVLLLGDSLSETYLSVTAVLEAARQTGAEAVHPGYGFLSENAEFAQAVTDAGLIFIGPSSEAIRTMGEKTLAREAAREAGVPLLAGSALTLDPADLVAPANEMGFPVVVKAAFGGGGRGMRVVTDPDELLAAAESATQEAAKAFGRAEIYLERYLQDSRHIEVQVLGDSAGSVVVVGDRDCTVQRRHQKMLEEAPAANLPDDIRQLMHRASVSLSERIRYQGAGTVEFLYSPSTGDVAFLEMNTRLQVEHGVTELVSGVDLVKEQLRIASGEKLSFTQEDVVITGHAIQARIAAEDPWNSFMPQTGTARRVDLPARPGIRNDFGIRSGSVVTSHFDSMLGKVLAVAASREEAAARLDRALGELVIDGLATTAPYLQLVLRQPEYASLDYSTSTVDDRWSPELLGDSPVQEAHADEFETADAAASAPSWRQRDVAIETDRGVINLVVTGMASRQAAGASVRTSSQVKRGRSDRLRGEPVAPMDAVVSRVVVAVGDEVDAGAVLVVLEAMKMEMPVKAAASGVVEEILAEAGARVATGDLLLRLRKHD